MIDEIEIEGFKAHGRTRIELGRLTVLVGPNGSGKSSVLELLAASCRKGDPNLLDVLGAGCRDDAVASARFRAGSTTLQCTNRSDGPMTMNVNLDGESGNFDSWLAHAGRAVQYVLDPALMGGVAHDLPTGGVLGPRGAGLAAVFANMRLEHSTTHDVVVDGMRAVVGGLVGVRARLVPVSALGGHSSIGHELLFDYEYASSIPADQVSTGTLVALAVLVAAAAPERPKLLMFDDIELGLHPKAQIELVEKLKAILAQDPELQIVITTHSPFVLQGVEARDVWIVAPGPDGLSTARRLSDHPDAERALGVLTAGELWTAEGEDWIAEPLGGQEG